MSTVEAGWADIDFLANRCRTLSKRTKQGVNVMLSIFGDFRKFSAKKMVFYYENRWEEYFVPKYQQFRVQIDNFLSIFLPK
jgi:hypothetical protein